MLKFLKKHGINILLAAVFLTGFGLLVYPTLSDYWNSLHQSRAISNYSEEVANIDNDTYKKLLLEAKEYNSKLAGQSMNFLLREEEEEEYDRILDFSGTGMIGTIEIDKIKCSLPIYHGTEDTVLQAAIGHLKGTSFPVGGESTHAVLSGHRGLPSAKLFTNLDRLEIGDTFVLRILDEVLTYEVDQILIVDPADVSSLEIVEGEDLCTLVTCTPYGINTHRLLVRGHRTKNKSAAIRVTADAIQLDKMLVAPIFAIPILLLLILVMLIRTRK